LILTLFLILVAFTGSIMLEASGTRKEVTTYLSHWEEDIAKSLLVERNEALLQKLLFHVRRANVKLVAFEDLQSGTLNKKVSIPTQTCVADFLVPLTLYGLPAGRLHYCQPLTGLLQQTLVSPVFMGFVIVMISLFLVFRLITARIETQKIRLSQKLVLHEELSKVSRQVAHDIRTPLTALQMLVGLDHGPGEDPDRQRLLQGAVGRIKTIADDLHQRGKWSLAGETCVAHLGEISRALSRELGLIFQHQSAQFDLASQQLSMLTVPLKPETWERMFQNILKNAFEAQVQVGAQSPVRVSVHQKKSVLEICFEDGGIGMTPQELKRAGQEGFTSQKKNGTGLGLFFVRQSLQSVGGELQIRNHSSGPGIKITLLCPILQSQNPTLSQGIA
jgi:signal transduction histidine kinase